MANIVYTPAFTHTDWIDNVDIVQAETNNGFNVRFNAIKNEFDALSAVVANINVELQKAPLLQLVKEFNVLNLNTGATHIESNIDEYNNPTNGVQRVYLLYIKQTVPTTPRPISHHFSYNPGSTKTKVDLLLTNHDSSNKASMEVKVYALGS